jgi:hypothetical protein
MWVLTHRGRGSANAEQAVDAELLCCRFADWAECRKVERNAGRQVNVKAVGAHRESDRHALPFRGIACEQFPVYLRLDPTDP